MSRRYVYNLGPLVEFETQLDNYRCGATNHVRQPSYDDRPPCEDPSPTILNKDEEPGELEDEASIELCNSKSGNVTKYLRDEEVHDWCELPRGS